MRYLSIFSGIEAASAAWAPLGWEPIGFSEIEPFPCALLAKRFPFVDNLGDITQISWRGREVPDVIVGGSPCQSFSVAGKRDGLAGESRLMWEYIRCVRELMPRWFLWENVKGALQSDGGSAFRCFLREMDGIGYGMAWRVLDARFFDLPQRRRRLFVLGYRGKNNPPCEVLFERPCETWNIAPEDREWSARVSDADKVPDKLNVILGNRQVRGTVLIDSVPTMLASSQPMVTTPEGLRKLTPLECERVQGFPDGWTDVPYRGSDHACDGVRYKALGNSMPVTVMRWIGERIGQIDSEGGCS